jgi:hypothetical protein
MRPPRTLQPLPGNSTDPIDAQDVAIAVARNYAISRENSVQLMSLQEWVVMQQAASTK